MAFRDDRDAQKQKAEELQRALTAAEAELAAGREQAERTRELERELAAAKAHLARIEERLPAPKPSRRAVWLAVATVGVAGTAGAFLLARSPAPSPEHAPVAVQPIAVAAPTPLVTTKPVTPIPTVHATPEGPIPPMRETTAIWRAKVKSATGLPLAVGSACEVESIWGNRRGREVVVRCGKEVLYRSTDKLEGMAQMGHDFIERIGDAPSTARGTLTWNDVGSRSGPRTQASIDTGVSSAAAWRETAPAFRVELTVAPLSDPYPYDDSTLAFSERIKQKAKVEKVQGKAPVRPGASCDVRLTPEIDEKLTCRALVKCGAQIVYGGPYLGLSTCETKDGKPTRFADEAHDGDPVLRWDIPAGKLELVVQKDGSEWSAELTVPPTK